jgi:hypothetical protein
VAPPVSSELPARSVTVDYSSSFFTASSVDGRSTCMCHLAVCGRRRLLRLLQCLARRCEMEGGPGRRLAVGDGGPELWS